MASINDILNDLYPKEPKKKEVKEQPMTKERALSDVDMMDYAPSSVKETPADKRAGRFVEQMDLPNDEAEETLTRAARERVEGARKSVGGFFSNLGSAASEAKERYAPSEEKRQENFRRAAGETVARETLEGQRTEEKEYAATHGPEPTSYLDEELVTLGKKDKITGEKETIGRGDYTDPWNARSLAKGVEKVNKEVIFTKDYNPRKDIQSNLKSGGILMKKNIQDAEWKKVNELPGQVVKYTAGVPGGIVQGALKAKGYLSETKLKYDASKYGINPEQFDAMMNAKEYDEKGNVIGPKKFKMHFAGPKGGKGYSKEVTAGEYIANVVAEGKSKEMRLKTSEQAIKVSQATVKNIESSTALRYAREEQMATVPQGGRKLVQFGSGNFGQTPYYVNQADTHGAIRSQFLPGQMSGVSTSLANSRLEMARMKQRVLAGAGGNYGAVQALMPSQSQNMAVISRLSPSGNQGGRPPPYGGGMGAFKPSVLTKLGAIRKK